MENVLETEYDKTRLCLGFVIYILKLLQVLKRSFYKMICLWLSGVVDSRYRPRFRLVGFRVGVTFSQNKKNNR